MSEQRTTTDDARPRRDDQHHRPTLSVRIRDDLFGAVPEPRPATRYLNNDYRNITTGTVRSDAPATLSEHVDPVSTFAQTGVIFASPAGVGVRWQRVDDELKVRLSSTFKGGFRRYRRGERTLDEYDLTYPVIEVNSMWVADLPEDHSLLILPRPGLGDNRFEVLPRLIDVDTYDGTVKIPLRVLESPTEFEPGALLAHAVPIHRDHCSIDGTVVREQADSRTARDEPVLRYVQSAAATIDIPDPSPASSVLQDRRDSSFSDDDPLSLAKSDHSLRDALELGWVVSAPTDLDIDEEETPRVASAVELQQSTRQWVRRVAEVSTQTQQEYYRIDTGWEVTVPRGYDLLVLPTAYAANEPFDVVCERISTASSSQRVPIVPLVRSRVAALSLDRGRPLVRLVPVRQSDPEQPVAPDTLTERQEQQVKRTEASLQEQDHYEREIRRRHETPSRIE